MKSKKISKDNILNWLLIGITIIFSVIFFPHFTNLLINSDSYAIMLPATFLHKYGTFGAQLGEYGDVFSPIFYRGGFSLLIYIVSPLFQYNWFNSAQYIIQLSYFLSIILIYFVSKKIFRNNIVGFFSSILLIFCYIFTQWSTLLMSEIPTIFLIILSLFFLVFSKSRKYLIFVSALVLGMAFTFRAEMMILLVPFSILLFMYHKKYLSVFLFLITSVFVWLVYVMGLYIFNPDSSFWLTQQIDILWHTLGTHQLFIYTFVVLLIFLVLLIKWPILAIVPAIVFAYLSTKINLNFVDILPPLYSYIYHDFPIIIGGILGLILIYKKSKPLFLFFTFYFFPLLLLYFSRGEYRYYVHTIMPFIVLSGFFIVNVLIELIAQKKKIENTFVFYGKKIALSIVLLLFFAGQIYLFTRPSFLPTKSYEQVVISQTIDLINKEKINSSNLVICSVFSEAIYFSTNISSQDCFDGFADIKRHPDQKKLIIIEEDISRHQSEFAQYLAENYEDNLIDEKWIVTPYIEKNTTSLPKYPIKWYLI